jgi:hypothetical protein
MYFHGLESRGPVLCDRAPPAIVFQNTYRRHVSTPCNVQVSLLRHCRTGGLEYCDSRSRLIDEGFNDDRRHPDTLHVEHVGSMR